LNKIGLLLCTALTFGANSLTVKAQTPPPSGAIDPTVSTSASALSSPDTLAQRDINLGRRTRFNYSYIGVGFNLGLGDNQDTTVGDTGFVINGKIAFNQNLSLRPAIVFADDTAFLFPVTYDFTLRGSDPFEPVPFIPYVGGGLILTTENNNNLGFLLSGGLDYLFSKQFVAHAGLNIGFLEQGTEVGLSFNLGYRF